MWRILDCFQKKVRDFRCSVHTKTTLTFQKNTWRVGGTGQAMVDGKKKKLELWNTTWPGDLLHTWTHTLGHVWEKPFLLHSFLSQQKTTLLTHNWEPCHSDHAGHTMADSIYSLSELWNTTWPEDSLHTRTHTSSCEGEKRFWLHSFLSPNVGCTSIPRGLYSTKHPFSLVKTAS